MDLSNWMRDLGDKLRSRPIIFTAIPGSHDSLSYSIQANSPIAPDAEPAVRAFINLCGPLARKFMLKWCVTQKDNVTDQLRSGIRYFDLRIATKNNEKGFYFVHGLYGQDINIALKEIKAFVEEHEEEIIILDFQHFYDVSKRNHLDLIFNLETLFGDMLCPLPKDIASVSLNWMKENGYKVIIIYRNEIAKEKGILWPSWKWPTPWPETMSTDHLVSFLDERLTKRPTNAGFVSQCLLTPTKLTVLHFWSGLHSKCAEAAASVCLPWLSLHPPGQINVAIADFVLDNDSVFPQTVITLNHSLT